MIGFVDGLTNFPRRETVVENWQQIGNFVCELKYCGLKYSSFPLQSDAMFETRYFCSAKYETSPRP